MTWASAPAARFVRSWADRVHASRSTVPDWLWWLAFVVVAAMYLSRLDAWLINDDEGSYLYAAWRISLGEVPYRDFLTPQLPAFLLPGGLLMKLAGPSAWHARLLASALTLGVGLWTWLVARRLFGGWVAVVTGLVVLLHPSMFGDYRTYRPDPFMMFFATMGVLVFARAVFPRPAALDPPERRCLAISGALFGLATLSKLFAPLVAAGCVAWLLAEAWGRRRPWRSVSYDVLAFTVPAVLVVLLTALAFVLSTPGVLDAVVGHHLRQGSGQGLVVTVWKGLRFYTQFLRYDNNAILAAVAIAVGVTAATARDRRATFFAWQLPTALSFLFLSRQLFVRHLVYLVPAMAVLFGVAVVWLGDEVRQRLGHQRDATQRRRSVIGDRPVLLAAALMAGLVVPWSINNWHRSWEFEHGTVRLGDVVELLTEPDDIVLSDYSELNFYSRRPTTYSGASFSEGAARSGQISWNLADSPHRIKDELGGKPPPLLVLDTSEEFAHLRFLRDYDEFAQWVELSYGACFGRLQRHHQAYCVLVPIGSEAPLRARFGDDLELLAGALDRGEAAPGDEVLVRSAWRGRRTDSPVAMAVRLVDGAGRTWAAADESLRASRPSGTGLVTTDLWVQDELSAERVVLRVPEGTPPGDYGVTVFLYGSDDLVPLEATDDKGVPLGQSVSVGRIVVLPSAASTGPGAEEGMDVAVSGARVGALSLLGHGPLPTEPVTAGTTFPLELWWRADGAIGDDLSTRVTLDEPQVGAFAADWSEPMGVPGSGSASWPRSGVVVKQVIRVPVLADAASGSYRIGVTPLASDGVPYAPGDSGTGLPFALGVVSVVARDTASMMTEPPDITWPLDAEVGGVARLVGVNPVSGSGTEVASAGASLPLELVWRARTISPTNYRVTVQLVDSDGHVLVQHDGEPADWTRPTTGWIPGEIVVDPHALDVPVDAPAGTYRLVVAMYDPLTLTRLPVEGKDADGDVVFVKDVRIAAEGEW